MKTIKMSDTRLEKFSRFSQIALALATVPLLPICLGAPMRIAYISVAILLIVIIIVNAWKKMKEDEMETRPNSEKFSNGSIDEDGGINYEAVYRFLMWIAGSGLAFFAAIVGLVIFWKEIISLIVKNPIPIALAIFGIAITVWLARVENKKECRENRKARKIDEERAWDY